MEGSLIQGADIVVGGSFFGLTPETLIDAQNHFLDGTTANCLRAEKNITNKLPWIPVGTIVKVATYMRRAVSSKSIADGLKGYWPTT